MPLLYRVDDQIYRGRQPKKEDIARLAQAGVHTVLDLRGGIYKSWEKSAVEAAGMHYVRIGLSGLFAPNQARMKQILALLQDPASGPVFVHCRRGADRSGVVIACYRMVHDHWTRTQAMQEARSQGISPFEILMRSYILHFDAAPFSQANR